MIPLLAGVASAALSKPSPATMPDGPISTTASGIFQSGPLVVGSKQVGGKGNVAGETSATQSQVPPDQASAYAPAFGGSLPSWLIPAVLGVLALGAVIFAFGGKRKGKR